MAYSREIIEEAKNLYLEIDKAGNRKYGLKSIAKILNKKYNLKINHTTIMKWRDREGWDDTLRQKLALAIDEEVKRQIEERPEDLTQEEKIKEIISRARGKPIIALIRLLNKIDTAVKAMSPEDRRFPRLAEVATKVYVALDERLEKIETPQETTNRPVIIINEIRGRDDETE